MSLSSTCLKADCSEEWGLMVSAWGLCPALFQGACLFKVPHYTNAHCQALTPMHSTVSMVQMIITLRILPVWGRMDCGGDRRQFLISAW